MTQQGEWQKNIFCLLTTKLGNAILKMPRKLVKEDTAMKKEEILAKSREENRNEDEREKQLRKKSGLAMFIAMSLTGGILSLAEIIFLETEILLYGIQLMIFVSLGVQNWYFWATGKKKIHLVLGIFWVVLIVSSLCRVIQVFISMM